MRDLTRRDLLAGACATSASCFPAAAQAQAIAEEGFVRIGGIDQWVAIRGQDRTRPAILFLHGGPCDAQSPHLSLFAPWEQRYVVANWDQRGSGATFKKNGTSTPEVTFDRIAKDAVEVAKHVLRRTGQSKLILVGHSWGALLGLTVTRAQPDLFAAFIGTGQPVHTADIVERMRASAIARARKASDSKAAAKLKSLSAHDLVTDMDNFVGLLVKWTEPFIPSDQRYIATPTAFPNNFCETALNATLVTTDARAAGFDLPIPYFIIQGRDDNRTPPDAARAFMERIKAPAKGYTAIEGGHFACLTNPDGFLNAMTGDLRRIGIR
jgi:pimeloyl-ACP methyl ester carboxylesterase